MSADVGKIGSSKYKNSKDSKKKAQRTLKENEGSGKRSLKLGVKGKKIHMGQEGSEGKYDGKRSLQSSSSNKARKRIYADQGIGEKIKINGNGEGSNRKAAFSRKGRNKVRDDDDAVEAKGRSVSPDPRLMCGLGKLGVDASESKRSPRKTKNAVKSEGVSDVTQVKEINKKEFAKDGGGEVGLLKNRTKSKVNSSKGLAVGKKKSQDAFQVRDDDDAVEAKGRSVSPDPRSMWGSGKLGVDGSASKRSSRKTKTAVKSEGVSDVTWMKGINKKEFAKQGGGEAGLLKNRTKSKVESSKGLEVGKKKSQDASCSSLGMKMVRDKKSRGEDSEDPDEKPKKKKRVIRIDKYDISNKRLDDGIAINETKQEEKTDAEEAAEMSKNAQFRAIQPSPSILAYVEDNLLGRRRLNELRRAGYNTELSAPLDNIPFSNSSERERIEENIFRNDLTFFAAAKVSSSFPPPDSPEIAFAGQMLGSHHYLMHLQGNGVLCGHLINLALLRCVSGFLIMFLFFLGHLTIMFLLQTINFFSLGPKLNLVDLPGYGFAYAKEEVKDAWEELVKEYVATRAALKRVCLLIDTKWGMKPRDREMIDIMERAQTKYQIVLTKTDVVFPIDVARRAMQIEESLKAHKSAVQPVMVVSSKSGAGIRSLRTVLASVARFAKC